MKRSQNREYYHMASSSELSTIATDFLNVRVIDLVGLGVVGGLVREAVGAALRGVELDNC